MVLRGKVGFDTFEVTKAVGSALTCSLGANLGVGNPDVDASESTKQVHAQIIMA